MLGCYNNSSGMYVLRSSLFNNIQNVNINADTMFDFEISPGNLLKTNYSSIKRRSNCHTSVLV